MQSPAFHQVGARVDQGIPLDMGQISVTSNARMLSQFAEESQVEGRGGYCLFKISKEPVLTSVRLLAIREFSDFQVLLPDIVLEIADCLLL